MNFTKDRNRFGDYLTTEDPFYVKFKNGKSLTFSLAQFKRSQLSTACVRGSVRLDNERFSVDIYTILGLDELDLSDPTTKEYVEQAEKLLKPKTEIGLTLTEFVSIFQKYAESGTSEIEKIPGFLDSIGYKLKEGDE